MRSFYLMVYRVSLTGWLGAALLFSTVALEPIRHLEIDAATRPRLALILFPGYYHWGMVSLTVALISGGLSVWDLPVDRGRRRMQLALICVFLASGCVLGDLKFVYGPLAEMMQTAVRTEVQPAQFRSYHLASMAINGVMVSLTLIAAFLACWPAKYESQGGSSQLPT